MINLGKEIVSYLDYCKYQRKLNEKTIKAYTIDLSQFKLYMTGVANCMEKSNISGYIVNLHKRYSPNSVKRKLASTNAFFNYLCFDEVIIVNPIVKVNTKFQEPKVLPKTIPLHVIESILSTAYKNCDIAATEFGLKTALRDIAIIELLFATGMRVSELCSLNLDDISMEDGSIRIMGKGARERVIQVSNTEVIIALKHYMKAFLPVIYDTGSFFVNRLRKRLTEQSVRIMIKRLCCQACIKIHITPHMYRHSFASLLLEEDVDIRYIQRMLGHSSIQTTQIYTHVTTEKQRQILMAKHPRNKFSLCCDV